MKLIRILLVTVLATVAKCDLVLEDTTATVSKILDKIQDEIPQPTELPFTSKVEKIKEAKKEQEMKGQPSVDLDNAVKKLETAQKEEMPEQIADSERVSRMYIESDSELTNDDIGHILQKLGFPVNKMVIPQSRGVIGENIYGNTNDDDDFYVLSFAPQKNPNAQMGEHLFSPDYTSEARYKSSWQKYLRKMFRKLRRSTRKFKRRGSLKSRDVTVEDIVRKLIKTSQEGQGFFTK